jgi:hypothetical protein
MLGFLNFVMQGVKMVNRIVHWLIFSVVMALLPLIFNSLSLATIGNLLNLSLLLSHGGLLIVSATLSASGIGEQDATLMILMPFKRFPRYHQI